MSSQTTIKRVLLYARVSSDDRDAHGDNLTSQLQICHEYAEGKGYRVVAELREDIRGVSGADVDAPELNRAVDLARAGEFDVLVVREIDRLARDINKQFLVESELKASGVTVEYALYDFPDTPSGRLNKTIYAALAQFERDQIRMRTMRGRIQSVARGNVMTQGRPPYGYREHHDNGKRTLVVHDEEAAIVRDIFRWYTMGDGTGPPLSQNRIAYKLTALGVRTAADKGRSNVVKKTPVGTWGTSSVRVILLNRSYIGEWSFKTQQGTITADIPAIVGEETFNRALRRRASAIVLSRRNTTHQYLLRSLVICGHCGYRMRAWSKPWQDVVYSYYRCESGSRPDTRAKCGNAGFRADIVDALVWEQVKRTLSDPDILAQLIGEYQEQDRARLQPLRDELDRVGGAIAETAARLNRLIDAFELDGTHTLAMIRARQERLEARLVGLEKERQRIDEQISAEPTLPQRASSVLELAGGVRDDLDAFDASFEDRRWLLEVLEAEITLRAEKKTKYAQATVYGFGLPELQVPRTKRRKRA